MLKANWYTLGLGALLILSCAAVQGSGSSSGGGGGDGGAVDVANEQEMLAALGSPSVAVIKMTADISISQGSTIPGALSSTGVYQLTRNVTITAPSAGASDWYPSFDISLVV